MAESGESQKEQVVVKVGVVGDSQIGKTSLMVKYVEGNFDEDYIQTLGMWKFRLVQTANSMRLISPYERCKFHGEDSIREGYNDHFQYLGSWRAQRIR